jgi:hypothetical protein
MKLTIEGNKFLYKIGECLVKKYSNVEITEITFSFPSTICCIIKFKANNTKYSFALNGEYQKHFKKYKNNESVFENEELFNLIETNRKRWIKLTSAIG